MDSSKTLENVSLGLTIIMVILPLFKDVIDRDDPSKFFLKKITWGGWVLIISGVLIIILNFVKQGLDENKSILEKNEHKKELTFLYKSDSIQIFNVRKNILDTLGMVGISATEIKRKLDSLNNKAHTIGSPIMLLSAGPTFIKYRTNKDLTLTFVVKNYGNGSAKNVEGNFFKIKQKNGDLNVLEGLFKSSRGFDFWPPGAENSFESTYHMLDFNKTDSIFYFIKINYKNENGKNLEPLRMIYLIPIPNYSGQIINIIDEDNFKKVKKYLKMKRIW